MKRGQLAILVFAALAVRADRVGRRRERRRRHGRRQRDPGTARRAREGARGAVAVTFAYSPEKEALLKPLIERFNASKTEAGGKAVFVEAAERESSGDAEAADRARPRPSPSRGRPPRRCGAACSTSRPTSRSWPTRTRRSCARRS